jgi:hypothetical protein
MKKIVILLVLATLVFSCSTTKKTSEKTGDQYSTTATAGRDGSSYEKAIIIKEKSELTGVDAEYTWLKQNYPGYKAKKQLASVNNNKHYDIITIVIGTGEEKDIYFDITNFYGHF